MFGWKNQLFTTLMSVFNAVMRCLSFLLYYRWLYIIFMLMLFQRGKRLLILTYLYIFLCSIVTSALQIIALWE